MERLTELLGDLIGAHGELCDYASGLSSEALVSELQGAIRCLDNNLPLVPPQQLCTQAHTILTDVEWDLLLESVRSCEGESNGSQKSDLGRAELEAIAVGVLWSSLLIREFEMRSRQEAMCAPATGPLN